MTVDELLDKRWSNPPIGTVVRYDGSLRRKTPTGWEITARRSDDILHRLAGADGRQGLWRTPATKHIGMKLVIEAVMAARAEDRDDDELVVWHGVASDLAPDTLEEWEAIVAKHTRLASVR